MSLPDELIELFTELKESIGEVKLKTQELSMRIDEISAKSEKSDNSSVQSGETRKGSFVTTRNRRSVSSRLEQTPTKENDAFLAAIAGAKRRNTIFPEPLRASDKNAVKTSLVISAYEVKEDEKILKLTVKSFQKLVKDYTRYKSQSADRRLGMVAFLSYGAQEELINDQFKKGLVERGDLDINVIQDFSDTKLYRTIAEYLRPKSLTEYKEKLWSGVTDFKKSLPRTFGEFNLEQYEDIVYPLVSKVCTEIQAIDDLFRYKATADSLRDFPKHGYSSGSHGEKSVNLYLQCFVPLETNFRTYIGDDDLKSVRSTSDFITLMLAANDRLAMESVAYKRARARATPSQPMSEQRQKYDQEKELKRRARLQERQPVRDSSKGPRFSILTRNSEKDPLAKQAWSDNDDDSSYCSPNDVFGDLKFGQNVAARPMQLSSGKQQRPPTLCFTFTASGKCEKVGCEYLHDKESAINSLLKRVSTALTSPLYPVKGTSNEAHLRDVQSAMVARKLSFISSPTPVAEESTSSSKDTALAELSQSKHNEE